jgi:prepilin-type N-terminal cleavage/methylation domain-containing protein
MIRRRAQAGFSLVELLVGFAILATAVLIGYPALLRTLHRFKLEGTARETAVLLQRARFDAIKFGRQAVVVQDFATREVVAFADLDASDTLTAGDRELGRFTLPRGVEFYGPGDTFGAAHDDASFGFQETAGKEGVAIYRPDGSAEATGALRIADDRENYLETRLSPAATGRLTVQKYHDDACSEADSNHECYWLPQGTRRDAGDLPGERTKAWRWN